jgi:osmotically inducible protein OsmC
MSFVDTRGADMPARIAKAEWRGALMDGSGRMELGSGTFAGPYDFRSRFQDGGGTNPEELIGAAHAGCFSMALANMLAQAGSAPEYVRTTANVHLEKQAEGFGITRIELETEGAVPGMDEATFLKHAEKAKATCPVSRALGAVPITLNARLASR